MDGSGGLDNYGGGGGASSLSRGSSAPAEPASGVARSARHLARAGRSGASRVVIQRRGSASDAAPESVSPTRAAGGADGRRHSKKARGGDFVGRDGSRRRSFSHGAQTTEEADQERASAAAAVAAADSAAGEGGRSSGECAPPPYKERSLSDLLSSSPQEEEREWAQRQNSGNSKATDAFPSPPPYDPNARWGWEKEDDSGSRRGSRRRSSSSGVKDEAGGGGGPSAGRVVTVDVYRPPAMDEPPPAPTRGRDRDGRRGDGGGGSRRSRRSHAVPVSGGAEWSERSSSGPLVEIMMSSPSASPTPSRSPESRAALVAGEMSMPPPIDSTEFGPAKWSWEGPEMDTTTKKSGSGPVGTASGTSGGGGGKADAGGASGRPAVVPDAGGASSSTSPVASNSLMVATDSLGNVRIYAKQALLKALNVSAFSS